ncbi:MAG: hypothetical protein ACXWV6_13030, partial [Chitinophagaceae bacterium]
MLTVACNTISAGVKPLHRGFAIDVPNTIKAVIEKNTKPLDTIIPLRLKEYTSIEYDKKELLLAAPGTKSVLFNTTGSKLYAMNLEGMSIYEFDQATRKVTKEFKFKPTKGTGWDYEKDKPISSY